MRSMCGGCGVGEHRKPEVSKTSVPIVVHQNIRLEMTLKILVSEITRITYPTKIPMNDVLRMKVLIKAR